jgi:hypothetical protein
VKATTMSTRISRRTVATGAAWSVPVLAVSAAAPAMAASGCPTIADVQVTGTTTSSATVQLTFANFVSGATITITGISGVNFAGGTGGPFPLTNPWSHTFTRSNSSNNSGQVTVYYTIDGPTGSCGSGTFTFSYTRP